MAREKNLLGLFHETLKDIYFAEKKILSALPEMANAAQLQDLKAAFELHETETEEHVSRLEKVFKEIDEPSGKTCDAIMGIAGGRPGSDEGVQGCARLGRRPPGRSAGRRALRDRPLRHTQNVGRELGLNEAVKLLEMTLVEEKKTDEALTKLALSEVNQHAQAA